MLPTLRFLLISFSFCKRLFRDKYLLFTKETDNNFCCNSFNLPCFNTHKKKKKQKIKISNVLKWFFLFKKRSKKNKKILSFWSGKKAFYFSERGMSIITIKTYWSERSETDNLTQILLFKQFFFHFTLLYCFPQKLNLFCGIVSGKKSSHWVFYENKSAFPLMIICLTLLWPLSFN